MFDIDVIVLVLFFYSVGLLFMIWITISVAAFRWVLYNVWCRFPPSAISQAFNSSWWRQVLKRRFTLYGFALLRDIETFAMPSQNPADPWKLSSISATSTGYQNKLDPTNQAIPFDIDVMLFPKVKCHDDVIMMIVDKVECHDVGWWPIFPNRRSQGGLLFTCHIRWSLWSTTTDVLTLFKRSARNGSTNMRGMERTRLQEQGGSDKKTKTQ